MAKEKMQPLLAGAGILAFSGLIAKVLSAVYRVPFQNLVGNTGFYVYQQVYPIYGIGMVLALSGWPLFVSKIITEQDTPSAQALSARRLFWLLLGISAILFAIVYGGAPLWAYIMGGNMKLTPVLKAVAWMFWLMPALTVGRGYAQGQHNMIPTALSQVVEQIVRVTVILAAAFWAVHHNWSIYRMGIWTTFSATLAGIVAVILLVHPLQQIWQIKIQEQDKKKVNLSWGTLLNRLWNEGGLLALIAAILVLLQLVDSITVMRLLEKFGLSGHQAQAIKGVYDRGQPLVQLGMVLATGLGTSLLPTLRQHLVFDRKKAFQHDFQLTMRLSIVLSTMAAIGLIAVMPVVNQILFGSREGSIALSYFVLSMVPATVITVTTSVLQSMNQTKYLGWKILVTLMIKFMLNTVLIPKWGIVGASIATVLALVPLMGLTLQALPRALWTNWASWIWFGKLIALLFAVGGSAMLVRVMGDSLLGTDRLVGIITTIVAVFIGVSVFIFGLWKLRLLTEEEWIALPKGDEIYALLKRRKNEIR